MLLRFVPRVLGALGVCLLVLLAGCSSPPSSSAPSTPAPSGVPSWAAHMATVPAARLPAEARETLALIDRGGPYPYARDGVVFGNLEGRLPRHQRGYYHEYTVRTPGSRDRGARRLITGQGGEIYYTDDHYKSFKAVLR
ncbi:ribonuclease domain-containing protein [Streptomyces naganishii]|uniref:ribonuclease domain-containing protein n=1 Tax=Streptomyces naganishii TaxID=285447 RepID=UPI003694CD96